MLIRRPKSTRGDLLEDPMAFEAFYRANAGKVLGFFMRRTLDAHLALDLTAETFAQAFQRRRSFRGRTSEEAEGWLFRIATTQHLQWLRRGKFEGKAVQRLGLTMPAYSDADLARVEQLADLVGLHQEVKTGLYALPETQRQAVWLRVIDELPYRDVGQRLGISEQTARVRVSRGLAAMRRELSNPTGALA